MHISSILHKFLYRILNTIVINNILIWIKRDYWIKTIAHTWKSYEYDQSKSLVENVGYSKHPEIIDLVNKTYEHFDSFIKTTLPQKQNKVLDIGCGVGLYLQYFPAQTCLYGIDFNTSLLRKARELYPNASLIEADYLTIPFSVKFDLIYSFSVIQYIERSRLDKFFKKMADELEMNGYLYINYPHAVRKRDLFYPTSLYIRYSPHLIEKMLRKYNLHIIAHKHYYDDRQANGYDSTCYHYPDGTNTRIDTPKNTYLLIAQKR